MQPGGRSVPLARATRTFPSATIEVAPSNTIERSRPGTPTDQGLVERNRACPRSEEHTSELQSQSNLVCRLLLEKKKANETKQLCVAHIITPTHHCSSL